MKNFAIYSSGGSSRIIKFYSDKKLKEKFVPKFIYYDGNIEEINNKLQNIKPNDAKLYSTNFGTTKLTKKEISQRVSDELYNFMKVSNIDYLFCFGDKLIKEPLLNEFKLKIINFHPSLLPSFPGLNSIDQALKSNVRILGNTAHFIDEGIDTGPIILQSAIARNRINNYEDVLDLQIPMLIKIWKWLDTDCIQITNNRVIINNNIEQNFVLFSD